MCKIKLFLEAEDGSTMVEYALIIGFICFVSVGAVTAFGGSVTELFKRAVLIWS